MAAFFKFNAVVSQGLLKNFLLLACHY